MDLTSHRHAPGLVRDAIVATLSDAHESPLSLFEIELSVERMIGSVASSSIRSYLNAQTPALFERTERGFYRLARNQETAGKEDAPTPCFTHETASLFAGDAFSLMQTFDTCSIHAVVTDPPYGLNEFTEPELGKLRARSGGVWRIPPTFDGVARAPLPRFTVLSSIERKRLEEFFTEFGTKVYPLLVPGANVIVASNALLWHHAASGLVRSGLENRGAVIRLVMTMRGGDRPKNAHLEFDDVSVMPRSMWEPWLILRKPLEGRVQDNLRKWKTGGFRRISGKRPFGDVIGSGPTRRSEREIAPHPALKPQSFMRQIVRSALPLGLGRVLDPFAGAGSTLAAALAVGYESYGFEKDLAYLEVAKQAIPKLAAYNL